MLSSRSLKYVVFGPSPRPAGFGRCQTCVLHKHCRVRADLAAGSTLNACLRYRRPPGRLRLTQPTFGLGQCPAYIGPRTDFAGFCRGYRHIDSCRPTSKSKPDNRSYDNSNVLCPMIGCSTHSHTLKATSCQVRAIC